MGTIAVTTLVVAGRPPLLAATRTTWLPRFSTAAAAAAAMDVAVATAVGYFTVRSFLLLFETPSLSLTPAITASHCLVSKSFTATAAIGLIEVRFSRSTYCRPVYSTSVISSI